MRGVPVRVPAMMMALRVRVVTRPSGETTLNGAA